MKKLNNNKGFSLVELLIALLIMAVIAAIAIAMFGGILDTSKGSADRETAETIKKGILTYMNSTNDITLVGLGGTVNPDVLIGRLSSRITIAPSGTNKVVSFVHPSTSYAAITVTSGAATIVAGTFGPFLDSSKNIKPQQSAMTDWDIDVHSVSQRIDIGAVSSTSAISISTTD